jgi:hypothetical protein
MGKLGLERGCSATLDVRQYLSAAAISEAMAVRRKGSEGILWRSEAGRPAPELNQEAEPSILLVHVRAFYLVHTIAPSLTLHLYPMSPADEVSLLLRFVAYVVHRFICTC